MLIQWGERMLELRFGRYEDVETTYAFIEKEFPVTERKALEVFQKLFLTGDYKLILGFDGQGNQVGFAYVYCVQKPAVLWLDFIVIEERFQGKGYGSDFIRKLSALFPQYTTLVLEVEIPTGEDQNQFRRLNYYERLGAKKLEVEYYIPNPYMLFEMYLYALPLSTEAVDIYGCLPEVIRKVYGFIHADIEDTDQLLERTIKSLEFVK